MSLLILIPSVHVIAEPDGALRADDKFLTGLQRHVESWDGPVRVLLRTSQRPLPFSRIVARAEVPGELILLAEHQPVTAEDLAGAAVVLASGDDHDQTGLGPVCDAVGARLVYAIEYTLQTRLRTAALDPGRGTVARAKSAAWVMMEERRRRRAFRHAAALQFNGYPAAHAYGPLDRKGCFYLDGRMRAATMASDAEMARRAEAMGDRAQTPGRPLRLITSGRLEPMKGAQDLIPAARAMRDAGVNFTLDIYGAGSLSDAIASGIAGAGLGDRVRLHAPVDFDSVLVPAMRRDADVFLSCHRQGDPSCSYLEAMGCGLPVIGTANEMWQPMAEDSGGGWVVPMGRPARIARLAADLAADPRKVTQAAGRALSFARVHDFDREFARRMDHLAEVARRPPRGAGVSPARATAARRAADRAGSPRP